MNHIKAVLAACAAALALLLCSCAVKSAAESYAMGAYVSVTVYGGSDAACEKAIEAVKSLDSLISWRDPESEIGKLNTNGAGTVSPETVALINLSLDVSKLSGGRYDMTVLPAVRLWGFDGTDFRVPSADELKAALGTVGFEKITVEGQRVVTGGTLVDLSALGKGAACGDAIAACRNEGVSGAVVSVGGSVGLYGTRDGKPFTVSVRDPFDKNGTLGSLSLTDCYISTSGSYEKYFTENGKTYHHILDPETGYPVENGLVSVTVVCGDGALSDALSTAVFACGFEDGKKLLSDYGAEGIFVFGDGSVSVTAGLADKWHENQDN